MYNCEILRDSINPAGSRLTTFRLRFPRFVLAEFNTHRVFSRNAGSSRAISITRRIAQVESSPVTPVEWGVSAKTMQSGGPIEDAQVLAKAKSIWQSASKAAVGYAKQLDNLGVHKSIVNRLMEPFVWVEVIVSSVEWDNFFLQRCSHLAQPEIRQIAEMMRSALSASRPVALKWGDWHMPASDGQDPRIAVGRLARVSYEAVGKSDDEEIKLCEQLVLNCHWSPFEHVAKAQKPTPNAGGRNYGDSGWVQYRAMIDG